MKFGDHATNIPATVYYGDKKNGSYAFSDHFKYKYDSMGNITEIRENGELYAKYTYDTIGRLVREDNKKLEKTTTFTYDTNGNILCRKEYAFTLTDTLDELASNNFAYTYDGDKLLSYNGKVCEYDIVGNPTTYRDKTATWANGRQLTSFDGNTFTYDNLGRRISKKIPKDDGTTETITFTYDASGNLIRQSNGISFIYDASGVCGLTYSDATYFYRKDILGNIVALLDANGEIVAKYTYDAWGKCQTTVVNSNAVEIANFNPFRYRGYYYDVETGLYFLKTRYYDPEIGRFITIDDISYLDPDSINGLNLYAYCHNNPIICVDRTGHFWDYVFDALFIIWGIVDMFNGGWKDWKNWVALSVDVVFAVLPFVPSGVGQVIKVGNKVDNAVDVASAINKLDNIQDVSKVTMIGRSMDRVKDTASLIGKTDELYDMWKGFDSIKAFNKKLGYALSGIENGGWLFSKLRKGYTIIDIGITTTHKGLGWYYGIERFIILQWQTRNWWKWLINLLF